MAEGFDLVIFGGLGDLSRRKLLPALYNGLASGLIDDTSRIWITSRRPLAQDTLSWLKATLDENPPPSRLTDTRLAAFAEKIHIVPLSLEGKKTGWPAFAQQLNAQPQRPLVHFLAIPPKLFAITCQRLGEYKLNHTHARVVIEKPLGHDRTSAAAINDQVSDYFSEAQTFRIDHYLGKEAVQNLLALRFSNILFEELWSHHCIDHIQISIAENQGVEGRAAFYEGTGALRDMVQNHLLQLLCLVAMEPPARMDAAAIREEKLKVLRSLEVLDDQDLAQRVVRGQYSQGAMQGEAVDGYTEDLDLDADSRTETFVAIKTHIQNWRWANVPFYLRTGKRLPERFVEIMIQFKAVPHAPLSAWGQGIRPNRFIIRLQPDDHLALRMMVKDHSTSQDRLKEVELNLDMAHSDSAPRLGPYLRLILDVVAGDQRLFVHRDEVDQAWSWIDKIIHYWDSLEAPPLDYAAGTWGPYQAHDLITRDGRAWSTGKRLDKKTSSKKRKGTG